MREILKSLRLLLALMAFVFFGCINLSQEQALQRQRTYQNEILNFTYLHLDCDRLMHDEAFREKWVSEHEFAFKDTALITVMIYLVRDEDDSVAIDQCMLFRPKRPAGQAAQFGFRSTISGQHLLSDNVYLNEHTVHLDDRKFTACTVARKVGRYWVEMFLDPAKAKEASTGLIN